MLTSFILLCTVHRALVLEIHSLTLKLHNPYHFHSTHPTPQPSPTLKKEEEEGLQKQKHNHKYIISNENIITFIIKRSRCIQVASFYTHMHMCIHSHTSSLPLSPPSSFCLGVKCLPMSDNTWEHHCPGQRHLSNALYKKHAHCSERNNGKKVNNRQVSASEGVPRSSSICVSVCSYQFPPALKH